MFSYGSGLASSMFCLRGRRPSSPASPFALARMREVLDVERRLGARRLVEAEEFDAAMRVCETRYGAAGFAPSTGTEELAPGSFYLEEVDQQYRRRYGRIPPG